MTRKKWALNGLAAELRVDRRRVVTIVEGVEPADHDARGNPQYWLRDVVDALFDNDKLDPQQERAKLDVAKREAQVMKNAVDAGELIPASEVELSWGKLAGAMRAKMLNIPTGLAAEVAAEKDVAKCEQLLRERVHEALAELSEMEPKELEAEGE